MRDVVVSSPVRTPVGRFGGALRDVSAAELAATVIRALVSRTGVEPSSIDDVILGHCYPNGEAPAIGRVAALDAGLPIEVGGFQLDRRCGSGLQAIVNAVMQVASGGSDVVIAGGAESMSGVEYYARGLRWGIPDPDWGDGPLDARKARLLDVIEDTGAKSLQYLYDFGDGWEHTLKVERIADAVPGIAYPRLIGATGGCPPEDVGGPWGYGNFLEAIADPTHERHGEYMEWIGGAFDPQAVDTDGHARALAALAKRWARKPAARRKKKT